jgi:transposase
LVEGSTEEAMPRPCSADLRERALAACERRDGSRAEIAQRFSVAEATLYAWLGQAREEGRRAAKPARGGRPLLGGAEGRAALAGVLADRRDATLAELADGLAARTGRRWSASALCRALKRLGWPRKKTLRATEQDRADVREERAAWRAAVAAGRLDPAELIFVDESGIDTRMTRRFARAPRGERALGAVPCSRWRRLTLIGAPDLGGLAAVMTVAAATSTAVFRAFVEQVLAPASRDRRGALVVMDNLAPHKAAVVHDAIRAAGPEPRLLPRYSPDLNPIEPCWSKIKTLLRAGEARSLDELDRELPAVLAAVTPADARGWFRHCGYAPD